MAKTSTSALKFLSLNEYNKRKIVINKISLCLLSLLLFSCNMKTSNSTSKHKKNINYNLPTIGLLVYEGVLITEVTATADVFTKKSQDEKQLFNVIVIAENLNPIVSEEGILILPDYTFENTPALEALFIPSAYDMSAQIQNKKLVAFIKSQNDKTKHIVSNCAGAQLVGKSGIADGKKIVTWIGGGKDLQKDYPKLLVQDDSSVTFVEDGKFSSSNGNLASYISALNLLEKLTSHEHRVFIESYLYLDRLKNWKK